MPEIAVASTLKCVSDDGMGGSVPETRLPVTSNMRKSLKSVRAGMLPTSALEPNKLNSSNLVSNASADESEPVSGCSSSMMLLTSPLPAQKRNGHISLNSKRGHTTGSQARSPNKRISAMC